MDLIESNLYQIQTNQPQSLRDFMERLSKRPKVRVQPSLCWRAKQVATWVGVGTAEVVLFFTCFLMNHINFATLRAGPSPPKNHQKFQNDATVDAMPNQFSWHAFSSLFHRCRSVGWLDDFMLHVPCFVYFDWDYNVVILCFRLLQLLWPRTSHQVSGRP